ncbi:TonB-dependent receptor [Sphingomonas morindae]|uniref:TonB-dependent receptor n=1 Tax=Sphingomonas morindae TaxID=1541170 RepID=A0ABY4X696_9SPHN|nr:TonB-dependent receptor [Sphingomonas morindae]USI72427.1 TonB-dependent receptor [Sphingomonas morindae]
MRTAYPFHRGLLLAASSGLCLAYAGMAAAQAPVAAAASQTPPITAEPQNAPADQAASPSQTAGEQGDVGSADQGAQAIVVTGIRGAQQRAINIKRNAVSVVDSISAEDIGKLPDRTISDSLQRIPGVQIRRDAGEGAAINIRGLPQVTTLLNGESYLGAQSITTIQPNFNDIPSQLFSGADVIKSTTADLLNAGISGTVNLRTRRPFDLKSGITVAAAAEGNYGDKVKKADPSFNGLVGWHNDRFGVLFSGAYTRVRLSNSHNGIQEGYGAALHNEGTADATSSGGFSPANRRRGTAVPGGFDINGDGDANDAFIVPQGFTGWDRVNDRRRLGLNGSAQWKINDALTLTGDAFFTQQKEYVSTAGFQMQNVNWQAGEFQPGMSRDTGAVTSDGYHINTTQVYNYDLGNFDSYAQEDRYKSQSQNYNLELKYDNGGRFKASLRGIYGKAHQYYDQSYLQFSLSNGQQWEPGGIGIYPSGNRVFNPNGYSVNTIAGLNSLPAVVDFTGSQPRFTLPSQLTSLLGDPANYALKTMSSEGNYRRNGDLKVVRGDATYEVNDAINFAFGARYSERSVNDYEFDRAAPLYAGMASNPAGCLVKWKAFDVPVNDASCSARNAAGVAYTAGLTRPATDPTLANMVKQYTLPAAGVPAMYVLNPNFMRNALAFQNSFYPGNVEVQNPGASFNVGVKQTSGYFQMNFKGDLFGLEYGGNAGLKIINTRLDILQYVTGSPQPYGLANLANGTVRTKRDFTDYLPAFNIAFNLAENLKLRFAYSKTMTLLDLNQWGGGLNPTYAIDTSGASPVFRVTGGSSNGNPNLDPWRATNVEASLEYYVGRASLFSVGAFRIAVDSFIQSGNIVRTDLPDNDGVVRNRTVSISTPVQGTGGTLQGLEGGAKASFGDFAFMPRFLSNFGIDSNITFSPSNSGQKDLAGNKIPFQDNSKLQTNVALFYQDERFQARVAWNYRSKRAVQSDFGGIRGLELYQQPTNYIDASVSYDLTKNITVYAQGSNLTSEYEKYYLTWRDERAYNNIYERRYTAGARVKF